MKKFYLILAIMLLLIGKANSQQIALYSMYFDNNYIINPAYAGTIKDYIPLRLSIHKQWIGIDNSPSTQVLSIHKLLPNKVMGIGGLIFHDSFGPIRQIGTQFTYAYHLQATKDIKVSFGVSAHLMQYMVRLQQEDFHSYEPILIRNRTNVVVPDASFGIYAYSKKWWAGLAASHVLQSALKITSTWSENGRANQMVRHYFLNGGYRFQFPSTYKLEIEPSTLIKFTEKTPIQVDINLRMIWNKDLWMGTSVRPGDSFVVMFGVKYRDYYFAISHDFTFSDLSTHTIGSEELIFGWNIGEKNSKSARFY